eukprot:UN3789
MGACYDHALSGPPPSHGTHRHVGRRDCPTHPASQAPSGRLCRGRGKPKATRSSPTERCGARAPRSPPAIGVARRRACSASSCSSQRMLRSSLSARGPPHRCIPSASACRAPELRMPAERSCRHQRQSGHTPAHTRG